MSTSSSITTDRWASTSPQITLNTTLTSETATQAVYQWSLYYVASYAASTSSARSWSVNIFGGTASGTYGINGVTGTNYISGGSVTVNKTASTQTLGVSCSMAMNLTWSGVYQGTVSASGTVTVDAISYSTPKTPTSTTATRNSDTSITVKWSGNNTDSATVGYWGNITVQRRTDGGSWTEVHVAGNNTATSWTDTTVSANHKYDYRCVPYNGNASTPYNTGGPTATVYTTPNAISSASVTRTSDTTQKVSWSGSSSSAWTNTYVDRRANGGSWVNVSTAGASTKSLSDTSTAAGRAYTYGVRPYNSTVTGSRTSAGTVYTTPTAPTSVTATKTGTSTVSLAVATSTYSIDGMQVQQSTDGGSTYTDTAGAWTGTATSTSSRTLTFTPSTVPAGTVQYRVRLYKASGGTSSSTLYSSYKVSNSVTTIMAPNAPTVTIAASVLSTGSTQTVMWTPNHPDGTSQTKAQVEITTPAGTATSYDVAGSTTTYTFTADQTGTYQVRVRTYGLYDGYGTWSSYIAFTVADLPTAYFTSPAVDGEVEETMPVEVEWYVEDATGVASQNLTLLDPSGASVISADIDTGTTSYSISSAVYALANASTYTLVLTVRGGSSLTTEARRTFATEWEEPPVPALDVVQDASTLSSALTVRFGNEEGTVAPTVSASVWRVLSDGTETLLEDGMDDYGSVIDRLPPLNADYSYRVVSYAESGISSELVQAAHVDSHGMEAFNFGTSAQTCFVLGGNGEVSESIEHGGESYHFALGTDADPLPMFYSDGDLDIDGSHGYTVWDEDEYRRLRAALRSASYPTCWFRSFYGHRAYVQADWSLGYSAESSGAFDVSADVTEVVWEEPVNG